MKILSPRTAAAVGVLASTAFFAAGGCESTDLMTPTEQARVEALDAEIDSTEAQLDAAELAGKDALDAIVAAVKEGATEDLQAALNMLNDAQGDFAMAAASLNAKMREQDQLYRDKLESMAAPASSLVGTFLPGAKPWMDMFLVPALSLFFKRPRRHVVTGLKNIAKGNIGQFVGYLGKALGWQHSSYESTTLLAAAHKMALEAGNITLAQQIKAVQEAQPGTDPT